MRKKSWVALLVTIVVASDVVLANLPGPAPSSGVVADVEGSKSFQGVVGNATWNYFGYSDRGVANPAGLALLPSQNFNGNNVTFSFRYAF